MQSWACYPRFSGFLQLERVGHHGHPWTMENFIINKIWNAIFRAEITCVIAPTNKSHHVDDEIVTYDICIFSRYLFWHTMVHGVCYPLKGVAPPWPKMCVCNFSSYCLIAILCPSIWGFDMYIIYLYYTYIYIYVMYPSNWLSRFRTAAMKRCHTQGTSRCSWLDSTFTKSLVDDVVNSFQHLQFRHVLLFRWSSQ